MKIQYVSEYIKLSREGLVPKMSCPLDQGLLLSNLTHEDEIYLYCLECNYKLTVGILNYENIVRAVQAVGQHDKL